MSISAIDVSLAVGAGRSLQMVALSAEDDRPHLFWQNPLNGAWSYSGLLGGFRVPAYSQLILEQGDLGHLTAVGLGKDDSRLYGMWQNFTTGAWSDAVAIGGPNVPPLSTICIAMGAFGQLELIGVGERDNQLYHLTQNRHTGLWNYQGKLTENTRPFKGVVMHPGNCSNLQLLAICAETGRPHLLWEDNQTGLWNDVGAVGELLPPLISILPGYGNQDNLQAVCLSEEGRIFLMWQNAITGQWNYGGQLAEGHMPQFSNISVGHGCGGNLTVIGVGKMDQRLHLLTQSRPTGEWTYYGPLGGESAPKMLASGMGTGYFFNLQVFGVAFADQKLHHFWEDSANGEWQYSGELDPLR